MKRLAFLLLFGLMAFVVTTGYSDSSVEKKIVTYQVDQGIDSDLVVSTDVEIAEFDLNSPYLGVAKSVEYRLSEKEIEGYSSVLRGPPDVNISNIRIYTN